MLKKLLSVITAVSFLSGCISFYNVPKMPKDETPYPQKKATIAFAYHGLDYTKPAISALAKKPYFTQAESAEKADYSLVVSASQESDGTSSGGVILLSLATLYLLPFKEGGNRTLLKVFIVDNKDGRITGLGEATVVRKVYGGIGVLLLGPLFIGGNYMESEVSPQDLPRYIPVFENFLARAAAQAYDPKSKLHTNEEYVNEAAYAASLPKKETPTAKDLLFFATYGNNFKDFSAIKSRVKDEVDQCAVSLSLMTNPNVIVPKEGAMYWQLLEYYKNSCASYRAALTTKVGISKEQLVQSEGNPTSVFEIDKQTQTLSYKKSVLNGEKVDTSETIYTLDNNIVTKVTKK